MPNIKRINIYKKTPKKSVKNEVIYIEDLNANRYDLLKILAINLQTYNQRLLLF